MIQPIQTLKFVLQDVPKGAFHWGNQEELFSFMRVKKGVYPLIWWEISNAPKMTTATPNSRFVETECSLIIATNTKLDWLNDQREIETFQKVIYPTAEAVKLAIRKTKFIELIDDFEISLPIPNQFVILEPKEYWDALILRFRARFTKTECLNAESIVEPSLPNKKFFLLSATPSFFINSSSPNNIQSVSILNLSNDLILEYWLDNITYGINQGSPNAKIDIDGFIELNKEILNAADESFLEDGKWLVNKTGNSGNLLNGGVYRLNPSRTSPETPFNNPLFFPDAVNPFPFALGDDTIQPVIINVQNGIITEIFDLPITGFSYE